MQRNSMLYCLFFAIAVHFFTTAKAQVNTTDSLALVDLYNNTNGIIWKHNSNWLTTKPVSTWYGVSVTGSRVTSLSLSSNELSGTLPASIGNLTQVSTISLGFNQLSGVIPSSIGNLVNLRYLELYHNNLSGSIPDAIGNLANAYGVYLYDNQLSGSIPQTIGNMASLRELYLYDNQLSGSIPESIGNLNNVTTLELNNNQLSSSIPSAVGNMKNLKSLFLSNNHLSGAIPASIGRLKQLRSITLQYNQLSGSIPTSFRKLRLLTSINVSYNYLTQDKNIYSAQDTKFTYVYVNNNLCTFNGIEFLAKHYFNAFYAPQNTILPIHQNGNTLAVYAGGSLSNNTYSWHKTGNADSVVIKHDSTFAPAESGMYYVTVKNKVAKQLTLHSDTIDFVMPAAKQSSNAVIAKATQPATIINHLLVYPNPATNLIHLQTNGTAIITITNAAGKILLSKNINNKGEINVSAFANGIYYIQNKTTGEVQKVVIMH